MVSDFLSKTVLAILVSCALTPAALLADDNVESAQQDIKTSGDVFAGGKDFQDKKEQGWFWKKDPPPPVEIKQPDEEPVPLDNKNEDKAPSEPIIPPATTVTQGPKPFTVEWFRTNIQKIRDKAIDDPTPENVRAYLLAQRIMLDKASRYKDMAQIISITDPLIDETARRSTSSFSSLEQSVTAGDNEKEVTKEISKKAGIFFFFKGEGCTLCVKQASILRTFNYITGIQIIPISVDGHDLPGSPFPRVQVDSGQAKKLQIKNFPAMALAIPPSTTRIISYGAISADQLSKQTVLIAHDAGIVSDESYKSTLPYNDNGYIDSNILKDMPEDYMNNSAEFIKFIQKKAGYVVSPEPNNSSDK